MPSRGTMEAKVTGFFAPDTMLYRNATDGTVDLPRHGHDRVSPKTTSDSWTSRVRNLRKAIASRASRSALFLGLSMKMETGERRDQGATIASGYVPLDIANQREAVGSVNAPRRSPLDLLLDDELQRQFAIAGVP